MLHLTVTQEYNYYTARNKNGHSNYLHWPVCSELSFFLKWSSNDNTYCMSGTWWTLQWPCIWNPRLNSTMSYVKFISVSISYTCVCVFVHVCQCVYMCVCTCVCVFVYVCFLLVTASNQLTTDLAVAGYEATGQACIMVDGLDCCSIFCPSRIAFVHGPLRVLAHTSMQLLSCIFCLSLRV